jgi:site-specific DNA recombinase
MTRITGSTGIYCRISDDQEGAGRGVARQEADARALAERLGLEVSAVWVDNSFSAFSGKPRPGYVAACEAIETGAIATLIADHPDRLHRSPRELEDFVLLVERTGVRVLTVTAGDLDFTTPEGRLMARITGAVARKESEDKQRRIRRKQSELRDRGRPTGRLGYPYDSGGVVNPERAAIVTEAADRLLAGETLGAICADFTERQVPTRSGGKWYPTTLRVMMTSPSLAGLQVHEGEIVGTGDWPPVLDRVTYERLRQQLTEKRRATSGRYLLSGLAICGACGNTLSGHVRGTMRLYACNAAAGGCGHVYVSREHLDRIVEARAATFMATASQLIAQTGDAEQLADEIAEAEAKLGDYARMLDAGELEPVEWRALRTAVVRRLDTLRDRAAAHDSAPIDTGTAWSAMSDSHRRRWISATLAVTVQRAKRRGGPFDPTRVELRWLR